MTEHIVTETDEGIRLDRWFKRHLPEITHALLEKALRKGDVCLGGKKAKSSARVQAGQKIEVRVQLSAQEKKLKPETPELKPDDIRMIQKSVLYKDADVIVINKPSGLAVQGGSKQKRHLDAMLDALRFEAKERPKLVHRLDKDTSGCLALARSANAAAVLAEKFAERETEKTYHALVIGLPMPLKGSVNLPLAKSGAQKEKMQVDPSGQKAFTEYRVIEGCATKLAWMELIPVTGRTHQLRVHMAAIGHPIVGDGKYGGEEAFIRGSLDFSDQLHLHAHRLVIPDVFGKTIDVKAPLPEHMKKSLKLLNIDGDG